jgi:signal peptidase I
MTPKSVTRKLKVLGLRGGALGVLLLLIGCSISSHPYEVAGTSMLPLLHQGDRILVDQSNQARSDLHDGDIIVLRNNDTIVVKRILAMPGETISGADRKVFRNGKQIEEPYLALPTGEDIPVLTSFAPRTVGSGELFVMGDNRDRSADSRLPKYGPVRFSDVVGKYRWTYWHASAGAK